VLPLLAPGLNDVIQGVLMSTLPAAAKYRRTIVVSGIFIIVLSLFLASCSTSAAQLVLTQGVLFGIGAIMLNFVHHCIFWEWFDKRRGEAMGIIWLGWRVGGLGFPYICQWLLESQGYEATLRTLVAPVLALLLPTIVTFRGRFADTSVPPVSTRKISRFRAISTPTVLFYLVVILLFSMVVNAPTTFLIPYAADIGLDSSDQALVYSVRMLGTMIGMYFSGRYIDSGDYPRVISASAIVTSILHFLLWGYARTRTSLFIYSMAVSMTSGGKATIFSILLFLTCLQATTTCVTGSSSKSPTRTTSYSELHMPCSPLFGVFLS
jgi:MFS family permease